LRAVEKAIRERDRHDVAHDRRPLASLLRSTKRGAPRAPKSILSRRAALGRRARLDGDGIKPQPSAIIDCTGA
jgi:hypothetical protein